MILHYISDRWIKRYADDNGRECSMCGVYQPWSEFYPKPNGPNERYNRCKRCTRLARKLRDRRLTIEQYQKMIDDCDNKCMICGREETRVNKQIKEVEPLSIDHCHKTGKVKGLLCQSCNSGIGSFGDEIDGLKKCLYYLDNNLSLPPKKTVGKSGKDCSLIGLYGITLEQFEELSRQQGGACAICGTVPYYGKSLCVDHNHDTGYIRGLLCINCNTAIGNFRESKELMRNAIRYLEHYERLH